MRAELASLESRIGYRFSNPELLRRSLTHSSLPNESRPGPGTPLDDNEQLEFLGDSILGFLVAEALVERYAGFRKGELSRLKAHLVSATHLHGVARRIDIGGYLELGRSEEMSGGRAKKTLLVNALEALIAAVYLDGGIGAARGFVAEQVLNTQVSDGEETGGETAPAITNFKSALQDWRRRANCRSPVILWSASAARNMRRRSPSRSGPAGPGPRKPMGALKRLPRKGPHGACTNGCCKRMPPNSRVANRQSTRQAGLRQPVKIMKLTCVTVV